MGLAITWNTEMTENPKEEGKFSADPTPVESNVQRESQEKTVPREVWRLPGGRVPRAKNDSWVCSI